MEKKQLLIFYIAVFFFIFLFFVSHNDYFRFVASGLLILRFYNLLFSNEKGQ